MAGISWYEAAAFAAFEGRELRTLFQGGASSISLVPTRSFRRPSTRSSPTGPSSSERSRPSCFPFTAGTLERKAELNKDIDTASVAYRDAVIGDPLESAKSRTLVPGSEGP